MRRRSPPSDRGPFRRGGPLASAKPDVVVAGTQTGDAYAEVKAMIQQKFNPKWLFLSNGASFWASLNS